MIIGRKRWRELQDKVGMLEHMASIDIEHNKRIKTELKDKINRIEKNSDRSLIEMANAMYIGKTAQFNLKNKQITFEVERTSLGCSGQIILRSKVKSTDNCGEYSKYSVDANDCVVE